LNCPPWNAFKGIDAQKQAVERNLRQFVAGLPANHVLLTGSRGCGKSSLIKALLPRLAKKGLRMIEVDKDDLVQLPEIVARVADLPYRFVIFTDDLSFEAGDPAYKPLKAALDGSLAGLRRTLLICATSNRRHLMPEYMAENLETSMSAPRCIPARASRKRCRYPTASACG
jgi:predicted AAA+ superfamily ATPase